MNRQRIAQELVAVARELTAADLDISGAKLAQKAYQALPTQSYQFFKAYNTGLAKAFARADNLLFRVMGRKSIAERGEPTWKVLESLWGELDMDRLQKTSPDLKMKEFAKHLKSLIDLAKKERWD